MRYVITVAIPEIADDSEDEKVSDGRKTVIRLSGRLRLEHLDELKTQIDGDQSRIVLDLDSVTLVDVEVVPFMLAKSVASS